MYTVQCGFGTFLKINFCVSCTPRLLNVIPLNGTHKNGLNDVCLCTYIYIYIYISTVNNEKNTHMDIFLKGMKKTDVVDSFKTFPMGRKRAQNLSGHSFFVFLFFY
jgi:hypothetical protein